MVFPGGALAAIVAASDFSDDAGNAVRRAAMLASQHAAALEVLHVVSRSSLDALREWLPPGAAERLVDDARRALHETAAALSAPAGARLAVGDVLEEILAACARASLLVVGAHGLNPLRDAILGTTAERLAGRCAPPILVVRAAPQAAYRRVLVALDLEPGSASLVEAALRIAPGALVAAAHAYDVPFEGALQRAGVSSAAVDRHRIEAAARARAAIEALGAAAGANAIVPVVERGHAARHVLDSQRSVGADLVVIGKRRRGAVESFVLGSVTRHVLADAEADVLVVPESA
jgi:nucleotide-binding universal stress UspA family protein